MSADIFKCTDVLFPINEEHLNKLLSGESSILVTSHPSMYPESIRDIYLLCRTANRYYSTDDRVVAKCRLVRQRKQQITCKVVAIVGDEEVVMSSVKSEQTVWEVSNIIKIVPEQIHRIIGDWEYIRN